MSEQDSRQSPADTSDGIKRKSKWDRIRASGEPPLHAAATREMEKNTITPAKTVGDMGRPQYTEPVAVAGDDPAADAHVTAPGQEGSIAPGVPAVPSPEMIEAGAGGLFDYHEDKEAGRPWAGPRREWAAMTTCPIGDDFRAEAEAVLRAALNPNGGET